MWLQIVPNDALFFRTARSFSMSDDFWAETHFPPHPSTFYGALRTFFIFSEGDLISFLKKQAKSQNPQKKNFFMNGPVLFNIRDQRLYFPLPLDLYAENLAISGIKLNFFPTIDKPNIFYSDRKLIDKLEKVVINRGSSKIQQIEGYIGDLENYLLKKEAKDFVSTTEIYDLELKVGIARNRETLSTKEGYLYRIEMNRFLKDWGFLIKISHSYPENLPKTGVFSLGGEGKTVSYRIYELNPIAHLENLNFRLENKTFKVYFATPAIFTKGFLPKWIDKESLEGEFGGIRLKLISAILGKYLRIGGWDMGKSRPKIVYKAVPAGSVYYFKILDNAHVGDVKKLFHFKNISDILPEEGYGLSFIGEV